MVEGIIMWNDLKAAYKREVCILGIGLELLCS